MAEERLKGFSCAKRWANVPVMIVGGGLTYRGERVRLISARAGKPKGGWAASSHARIHHEEHKKNAEGQREIGHARTANLSETGHAAVKGLTALPMAVESVIP